MSCRKCPVFTTKKGFQAFKSWKSSELLKFGLVRRSIGFKSAVTMSVSPLSPIDSKILMVLHANPLASNDDVAREVDITKSSTSRRITSLRMRNLLSLKVNHAEAYGLKNHALILFKTESKFLKSADSTYSGLVEFLDFLRCCLLKSPIFETLKDCVSVIDVFQVEGDYDAGAFVAAEDTSARVKFVTSVLGLEGITDSKTISLIAS